jgi:multiple sugar transport system permease protein
LDNFVLSVIRYLAHARQIHYSKQLRLFLAPYVLGTLLLTLLPALVTLFVAFTRYDAVTPPVWVGLENFQRLFDSPLVRSGLRNTLIFVLLAVPLRLLGALGLALLLRPGGRLFSFYRAAAYLPTIIPEVAYALIWLWILTAVRSPTPAWARWACRPDGWPMRPPPAWPSS